MNIKQYFLSFVAFMFLSCTTTGPGVDDRPLIDYKMYQGKWYEIARLPNPVEEGLTCITMTYEYQDEGIMTVTSSGKSRSEPRDVKTLTGRAWIPDGNEPEKIKIQFIWPVTLDYHLIHIDEAKGYAVLGSPYKHQLWILSRTPVVKEDDLAELVKIAARNQYKTDDLIRVEQICE